VPLLLPPLPLVRSRALIGGPAPQLRRRRLATPAGCSSAVEARLCRHPAARLLLLAPLLLLLLPLLLQLQVLPAVDVRSMATQGVLLLV
jgi:hypothetical protein